MSALWYVVPYDEDLNVRANQGYGSFGEAKEKADILHQSFGHHFHVIRVETAWTTKTLAEAMNERGDRNLAKFTEESNAYHAKRGK